MKISLSQKGFTPLVIIIAAAVGLSAVGAIYYFSTRPKAPVAEVTLMASSSNAPTLSPSPTPIPTPKPTVKPTLKPTPKPTIAPTSAPVKNGLYVEPNNITLSKKKSELGENIAEVTLYNSGTHNMGIKLSDGTVGIFGVFKDSGNIFLEGFHDKATIQIGFVSAFGREIKTGVNKVTLQIVEADNILDVINSGDIKLTIPITVTVTD